MFSCNRSLGELQNPFCYHCVALKRGLFVTTILFEALLFNTRSSKQFFSIQCLYFLNYLTNCLEFLL